MFSIEGLYMTKGQLIKKEIINYPEHYFNAQAKTLDARIENVKLSKEQTDEISSTHVKKFIRDKVLGIFKVGEIVSEVINWNESVDEDLKEAKKEFLLAQYFDRNDQHEMALTQLKEFLSSPQGNTIFNKILRILDDTSPDIELSSHLSSALIYIVRNDFAKLFEQHKYSLSQIEKLTPQALTIMAYFNNWPLISLGTSTSTGTKITSDWLFEFTQAYCAAKGIHDQGTRNRVQHSINELISSRLIEAHRVESGQAKCVIAEVGKGLLPYISAS